MDPFQKLMAEYRKLTHERAEKARSHIGELIMASKDIDLSEEKGKRVNIILCLGGEISKPDELYSVEQYIKKLEKKEKRTILIVDSHEELEERLKECNEHNVTVHLTNVGHSSDEGRLGFSDLDTETKAQMFRWLSVHEKFEAAKEKFNQVKRSAEEKLKELQKDLVVLRETKDSLDTELQDKKSRLKTLEASSDVKASDSLLSEHDVLNKEIKSLTDKKRKVSNSLVKAEQTTNKLKGELDIKSQKLRKMEGDLRPLKKETNRALGEEEYSSFLESSYRTVKMNNKLPSRLRGEFLDDVRCRLGKQEEEIVKLIQVVNHNASISRVRLLGCATADVPDGALHTLTRSLDDKRYDGRKHNVAHFVGEGMEQRLAQVQKGITREGVVLKGELGIVNPSMKEKTLLRSAITGSSESIDHSKEEKLGYDEFKGLAGSARFFKSPEGDNPYSKGIREAIKLISVLKDKQGLDEEDVDVQAAKNVLSVLASYPDDGVDKRSSLDGGLPKKYVSQLCDDLNAVLESGLSSLDDPSVGPT